MRSAARASSASARSSPSHRATPSRPRTRPRSCVDLASDELNDLRELRAPDELRDSYDAYLASRTRALDQLERGRDAAADRDTDAYVEAQAKVTADQPSRLKLAQAVGLEDCSVAPETGTDAAKTGADPGK